MDKASTGKNWKQDPLRTLQGWHEVAGVQTGQRREREEWETENTSSRVKLTDVKIQSCHTGRGMVGKWPNLSEAQVQIPADP